MPKRSTIIEVIMKSVIFLVVFLATLENTLAQRVIEGFNYLGPVPSLGRTASNGPKYYYISENSKTWDNAYSTCVNEGGQLATPFTSVQDDALRDFMWTTVTTSEMVWIGAKSVQTGTTYRWITENIPVAYNKLNTACLLVNTCVVAGHASNSVWYWCAYGCTTTQRFVCELK